MQEISEGKAKILTHDGVFYNPRMKFCRDFDMTVFSKIREEAGKKVDYLDALSGTGIRGIRACLEADYNSSFNDRSRKAVENIKENLRLNKIEAEVFNRDACILMREIPFLHIDIDPFGSPSEFLDSACIFPKYLSVTATDTAALCGSSPFSGLRKYASFALKTEYYLEVGVRVLIGRIFSESAKYDKAPQVLISFTKEHFYRVHIRFKRSPSSVKRAFKKFGYLFHCFKCSRRYISAITEETFSECDCGCRLTQMGPLWIGELHEAEFVKSLETPNEEIRKVVERIEGEADIPFYYDLHVTTRRLRISPPPIDSVIEGLEEAGFVATRTRFSGTSIKTNADIDELENILRNLKS